MRVLGDAAEAEKMGQAGWTDYVMLQTLQLHRTAELALTRIGVKPSLPQHSYVLRLHITERHMYATVHDTSRSSLSCLKGDRWGRPSNGTGSTTAVATPRVNPHANPGVWLPQSPSAGRMRREDEGKEVVQAARGGSSSISSWRAGGGDRAAGKVRTCPRPDSSITRCMRRNTSGRGWWMVSTTPTPPAARPARMSTTFAALLLSRPAPPRPPNQATRRLPTSFAPAAALSIVIVVKLEL